MTKPPSDSARHDPTKQAWGPAPGDVQVNIRLTASAQRHVERNGLSGALMAVAPAPETAIGDILSVAVKDALHDFAVTQRRWTFDGGTRHLELTIDHPAFARR